MTDVLELNDLELTLYREGEIRYQAPAVAIVREDALIFGEQAIRQAKVHPQQANQQYLNRMNADPLPHRIRMAANHADLVYLHLKELAEHIVGDTVLAVPGSLSADQLGILLGICHEASIEVSGFVQAAVASLTGTPAPERAIHIDVFLQHMQVSELSIGDDEVRHERAYDIRDCGFTNLIDGWVNLIADRFVQETRFDPLHTADSEQQLYNQVYDWVLGAHSHNEVPFQVSLGEQQRRVELPRTLLEQKAAQRIERLTDALLDRAHLVLTARAARLPGLCDHLKGAGFELTLLDAGAVASGCDEHITLVRTDDSELRLVSRLPHTRATVSSSPAEAPAPTHLLKDHVARPISAGGMPFIDVGQDTPRVLATAGVTLNGKALDTDVPLSLGDRIDTPEGGFTAIRLES